VFSGLAIIFTVFVFERAYKNDCLGNLDLFAGCLGCNKITAEHYFRDMEEKAAKEKIEQQEKEKRIAKAQEEALKNDPSAQPIKEEGKLVKVDEK